VSSSDLWQVYRAFVIAPHLPAPRNFFICRARAVVSLFSYSFSDLLQVYRVFETAVVVAVDAEAADDIGECKVTLP
jgi:hypothetical protein